MNGDQRIRKRARVCVLETEVEKGSFKMFTFSKGGQETEELLKKKNFVFQGYEMSLKQLLFESLNKVDLDDLIDSSILAKLANDEKIAIGDKLSFTNEHNEKYYIQREFRSSEHHVIPEKEICNFVKGLKEKIILISEPNASGKTTVLSSLAATIKSTHPHLWILHIDLSHYIDVFEKLRSTLKSFTIHDFLNRTPNELKTNFEKNLFSVPGKVLLMIDGIDEVCSEYEDLILIFLWYCEKQSNFLKIFMANAINIHKTIHTEFIMKCKICYIDLYPFSKEDQLDFFNKYWEQSLHLRDNNSKKKCNIYAKKLISEKWIDEENENVGVPLQIRMLAEVLENSGNFDEEVMLKWTGCYDFISSNVHEPLLPKKPNLVELCQLFIYKNIINNADTPQKRSSIRYILQKIGNSYLYRLAVETTLSKKQRKHFMYKIKSKKIPEKLKFSGILKAVDGKFRFLHRVFAEYFLAESILNKLQKTSNNMFLVFFVKTILCSDLFRMVRLFIGDFLQNDINSLPPKTLKYIGQLLHQNDLVPFWNIEVPKGSFAFFGFIFKCFELYGTSPNIYYTSVYNNPVLHYAVERQDLKEVTFLIEKGAPVNSRNQKDQTVLYLAARQCNLVMMQYLVNSGADIKCKDEKGKSPLHLAIRQGGLNVVEYLLEHNVDINSKDREGYTPLIRAAKKGVMDIVEFLVAKGADIDSRSKDGSALFCACQYGNFDIATFLITKGADVTLRNDTRETLLHVICSTEMHKTITCIIEIIKSLLEKGIDINSTNKKTQTALHYAIDKTDRISLVRYLVEHGADINCVDRNNDTPLDKAISKGAFKILRYLMERDVEHDYRNNLLFQACRKGYLNVIQYLAEKGENLNIRNDHDKTLLFASVGNNEVTKFLLDQGVEVNFAAPLDEAVRIASIDTVKLLMERGAYETNKTVQLAASRGDLEIVKLMVEVSEGIRKVDNVGNNLGVLKYLAYKGISINKTEVLCNAAKCGNINIIKFLIEKGINVNKKAGCGSTALHEASRNNRLHAVRFLVKHEANVNLLDEKSCTALQISAEASYFEIAKFLVENGTDMDSKLDDGTPILQNVAYKDINILKYLVEQGARINVNGHDTLYCIIETGQLQILDYLLRKFPDLACSVEHVLKDFLTYDYSGFDFYWQKGIFEIIKYLVDGDMKLDIRNINCQKLLLDATAYSDLEFLKFLLKKGVDINSQYKDMSALYVCRYLSIAKFLVDNGADVNAQTVHGQTALHTAAQEMNFDLFRFLIKAGADVNAEDENGVTPVQFAIKSNNFNKVKYVLENDANLSEANLWLMELQDAIQNDDFDILKLLIERGVHTGIIHHHGQEILHKALQQCDLDFVKMFIQIEVKIGLENKTRQTKIATLPRRIFCYAGEQFNLDVVRYLVHKDAKINVKDKNGDTILHKAVYNHDVDMVKLLLENGAYANSRNRKFCTPIQIAVEQGDLYITKVLVENRADINVRGRGSETVLCTAVKKNDYRLVRYLLERGANVNAKTRDGRTALKMAITVSSDRADIIKLLARHGANFDALNRTQSPILRMAMDCPNSEVIETVIINGADISILNWTHRKYLTDRLGSKIYTGVRNGKRIRLVKFLLKRGLKIKSEGSRSLFQFATANGDLEVVKYLRKRGMNPNAKLMGYTALHSAAISDQAEMIKYLIECGADVNSTDIYGRTALYMAAQENCLAAVKILINLGADVSRASYNGFTPFHTAIVKGSYAVVKYLKKIGAGFINQTSMACNTVNFPLFQ